jgi:Tol biopolymer transport system component
MKKIFVILVCVFLIATIYGASIAVMAGKGGGGGGGGKPPKDEPPADPSIAYRASKGGTNLMVMNADGSNQFEIFSTPDLGRPSWSPNGDAIAFTIGFYSRDLWRIDVSVVNGEPQGSNVYKLAQDIGYNPSWSPSGNEIAFIGKNNDGGYTYLQTIPATGGTIETLYTCPDGYWVNDPTWSNDGSRIAFVEDKPGEKMIKILDLSDSSITTVYGPVNVAILHLDWARTKDVLVFEMPPEKGGLLALFTLDITEEDPTPQLIVSGNNDIRWPSWSPDDSMIAFEGLVSTKGNHVSICTYDFSTDEVQPLAKGTRPGWSRS